MSIPTDRGYVVVVDEGRGAQTVLVASGAIDGLPKEVYAMHVHPPAVTVHPEVSVLSGNGRLWTTSPAEVYVDDAGAVHVSAIQTIDTRTLSAQGS